MFMIDGYFLGMTRRLGARMFDGGENLSKRTGSNRRAAIA